MDLNRDTDFAKQVAIHCSHLIIRMADEQARLRDEETKDSHNWMRFDRGAQLLMAAANRIRETYGLNPVQD